MTHDFAPMTVPGSFTDQHGCRLVEDAQGVRLYFRTRYDAHGYAGTLAQFLSDPAPVTRELGGAQRPAETY